MSDTNVQECNCCQIETDCINGLCELCSDYNYKLQKQSDLLTLGILQEKNEVKRLKDDFLRVSSAVHRGDIMALSDIVEQALKDKQ